MYGFLFLVFISACHPPPQATQNPTEAVLTGQSFTLRAGESTRIQSENLLIIFESVLQDSRCPAQVLCVTAGEARISVLLSSVGGAPERLELSTQAGKGRGSVLNYVVELRALVPYPQLAEQKIPLAEYIATLVVFSR